MHRRLSILFFWLSLIFLAPSPASAVAPHGRPEGFFIHQAAHLLVFGTMLFFIFNLKREGLLHLRGFRILAWACGIFNLWNLGHFFRHFSEIWLTNPVIMGEGLYRRLLMEDFNTWYYYLSGMDNWLLALSFLLLYLGLRALARTPEEAE